MPTSTESPADPPHNGPPSPCTGVCALDAAKVCLGCRRTVDEIVAWAGMSAEQQWAVIRDLPQRGR